MRASCIASIAALASAFAHAQPAFDAASVKVSPPIGGQNTYIGTKLDPGRVRYSNLQLTVFVMTAFGMNADRIVGIPGEFKYPLAYTIEATFPVDTPKEQLPQMLQSLLAERFKLKAHHETRPTRVYALVIAKNGPKIKPSEAPAQSYRNMRQGQVEVKKMPLAQIANIMHNFGWVDRTVVDQTKLTGDYDFSLEWRPENSAGDDISAPSIFTAVQEQWGLRLEPKTLPLDILVVDHVEKPGAN